MHPQAWGRPRPALPRDHRQALAAAQGLLSSHTEPEKSGLKGPSTRISSNSLPPRMRKASRGDEPQVPLLIAAELRAESKPPTAPPALETGILTHCGDRQAEAKNGSLHTTCLWEESVC